jgi:hypothetical protein
MTQDFAAVAVRRIAGVRPSGVFSRVAAFIGPTPCRIRSKTHSPVRARPAGGGDFH